MPPRFWIFQRGKPCRTSGLARLRRRSGNGYMLCGVCVSGRPRATASRRPRERASRDIRSLLWPRCGRHCSHLLPTSSTWSRSHCVRNHAATILLTWQRGFFTSPTLASMWAPGVASLRCAAASFMSSHPRQSPRCGWNSSVMRLMTCVRFRLPIIAHSRRRLTRFSSVQAGRCSSPSRFASGHGKCCTSFRTSRACWRGEPRAFRSRAWSRSHRLCLIGSCRSATICLPEPQSRCWNRSESSAEPTASPTRTASSSVPRGVPPQWARLRRLTLQRGIFSREKSCGVLRLGGSAGDPQGGGKYRRSTRGLWGGGGSVVEHIGVQHGCCGGGCADGCCGGECAVECRGGCWWCVVGGCGAHRGPIRAELLRKYHWRGGSYCRAVARRLDGGRSIRRTRTRRACPRCALRGGTACASG